MTREEFFHTLLKADSVGEATAALKQFARASGESLGWVPVGGRPNNRGVIEVSADPGRSLVERLTNAVDAVLEVEHDQHDGRPACNTPKEAALAWLNVPIDGLSALTPRERRALAIRCTLRLLPGDGKERRVVEVIDHGIGISAEQMPNTILSLNESNKIQKRYLAGTYGQGGSSTFAICDLTLIASRVNPNAEVAFSIVRYEDLPAEDWKTGHYVYLVVDGKIPSSPWPAKELPRGTLIRHVGYDLSGYPSPVGPRSVYGLLNRVLFDPVLPVWLDNRVHSYRRVIKGSRNALNGAVDEGDEETRGPNLTHSAKLYFVELADFGRIGMEYWLLGPPTKGNRRPSEAFVNPSKPIVLTQNGQNHAELSQALIRREAELPYLAQRLIYHIDCNFLTPEAKRALFVSSREDVRSGIVRTLIEEEIIKALRADDELRRLNEEAKRTGRREEDELAARQLRQEVARLLRVHGLNIAEPIGGESREDSAEHTRPAGRARRRTISPSIALQEPPSYVRILWENDEPISFYPGQRRYIRLETDAHSSYHDPSKPKLSRLNLITVGSPLKICGSTALQGGRMRVVLECPVGSQIGSNGLFRVELQRVGLPMLEDHRDTTVVEEPQQEPGKRKVTVPPFKVQAVSPDDDLWTALGWPEDTDAVASSAEMESGTLIVYYSTAFPNFQRQRRTFEVRDVTLAESYTRRYEVWLAVHSLLYYQDQQKLAAERPTHGDEDEEEDRREQAERRRIAALASFFASQEASAGEGSTHLVSEEN